MAPEVECIGKGKAHRPYEFGVNVSVATTARRPKGDQFVTHVAALPGHFPSLGDIGRQFLRFALRLRAS
jgi:hypothetical protein